MFAVWYISGPPSEVPNFRHIFYISCLNQQNSFRQQYYEKYISHCTVDVLPLMILVLLASEFVAALL
jgi:hypothetical protein